MTLAVLDTPSQKLTPCLDEEGLPNQCTAKSKRTGERCQRFAMEGSTKCYHHGGKRLLGPMNPSFKHGRYSQYLPAHLQDDYKAAVTDTELLDLTANVGLVDVRLQDLLRKLADGESLESWSSLGNLLGPLQQAIIDRNGTRATALMNQVLAAWQAVYDDSVVWKEIIDVTEARRKLVESERKRLIDMDLVITADRAYMLVAFLQDIIMRHITDEGVKASIAYEIRRVLADGAGEQSRPGRGEE